VLGLKPYLHATPGRLRVKVRNLKNNEEAARSLEVLLRSQPGIHHVRPNPVTGNVLVVFDQDAMSHSDVIEALVDLGHLPASPADLICFSQSDSESLRRIGFSVGTRLAKVAISQLFAGHPVGLILNLL
jgi:hypothetical protein